jgi:SAM-dependent methyltransferase
MSNPHSDLNNPARVHELKKIIEAKPSLSHIYGNYYQFFKQILARCPKQGVALELGSGAGFIKKIIPEITTSDYLAYEGIDKVIDATQLPYEKNSVKFMGMINVLHHIAQAETFFKEAERVLLPGGRLAIIDQHHGWLSRWILKYAHHEPYDSKTQNWSFDTTGPVSGANGALAWIIFQRDRKIFESQFPQLQILSYQPHSPLIYWLSGGLKPWGLLPNWAIGPVTLLDKILIKISNQFGSFVNIEITKRA